VHCNSSTRICLP